jgi:hypothetical protein
MHQLRVAAVAKQICESLNIEIDKEVIIKTCLVHDMGNIIKSNLPVFPDFLEPEGLEYWEAVKKGYISKYGNNEHEATVKILQELNLPTNIVEFANHNRFSLLCDHAYGKDLALKIIHYSDMRVCPHGVISYEERMNEAGKRYKNHPQSIEEIERLKLVECGRDIEKQIFAHSNIKPEDITDESVAEMIEELKSFEI